MARSTAKKAVSKPPRDARKPPAPFIKAPASLEPFTSELDETRVYIVHIDRFPAAFKKRIFAVPVLLNVSIAALLVWRAYSILPTYLAIFISLLGIETPATVNTSSTPSSTLTWILIKRVCMFMFDFVLCRFIVPWPVTFFFEAPANPCYWRRKIGFRDEEVCVRVSRDWGAEELLQGVKVGGESPFFATRILPAIERGYMRKKTAYLMMGKDWDLEFGAMCLAHNLVQSKSMKLGDFEKAVLVWEEKSGWLYWPVHVMDEAGAEEENRKRIVELKDKLTAMGKESLFFRWIEIVQYESGRPGGFTAERQRETLKQVEDMFERQGVDFREVLESVGGLEGMPGLENAPPPPPPPPVALA